MSLHTSSLLAYLYNNVHAFSRTTRTAPISATRKKLTELSHHRRRGKQQEPHAHAHKNQAHNQTSPHASPRGLPKKSYHNSPSLPLTKDFKGLHRDKTLTSSSDHSRFVLFFLLFSFPLFTLFFFILLGSCLAFFFYLSHLPSANCSRSFLQCMA